MRTFKAKGGGVTESILEPSTGLIAERVSAERYDGQVDDPDEVIGRISEFVPRNSRVLDVGCGTGSVSCAIRDKNCATIVGVEPSNVRASIARGRGIEVIGESFSEEIVDRVGQFDVVLFADVLEHLSDPEPVLRLARRCLRPDGLLVVSLPNVAHWSVRTSLLCGQFEYESCGIMDVTHLRWFTENSLRRLLRSAGYEVCQCKFTAGMTLPVYSRAWPWRSIPSRLRDRIIRRAARWLPRLFGCQVVIQAKCAG
jgi:methionine biosynthesis protein MetW